MAFDNKKNFGYTTVTSAPAPVTSGTSIGVFDGTVFPAAPFNAIVWPIGEQPTSANAEVVRVTLVSTNTLTVSRAQESSAARSILIGDQISNNITAKALTDIEALAALPTNFKGDIQSFYEDTSALTITANVLTVDPTVANVFTFSFNANITTTTLNNIPASGKFCSMTFVFTADGSARTWAWLTSTVKWSGGVSPTFTSTNNKKDAYLTWTVDGGTNWYGSVIGQNL